MTLKNKTIKTSAKVQKLAKRKSTKPITKKPKKASSKPEKKGQRSTGFKIDYIVKKGEHGLGIFANQNIK